MLIVTFTASVIVGTKRNRTTIRLQRKANIENTLLRNFKTSKFQKNERNAISPIEKINIKISEFSCIFK